LFPNAVSNITKRKDISENTKQKILGDNAKKLYGW
jgi:predicted TIM-barrel fold metal-dependent hydrolase